MNWFLIIRLVSSHLVGDFLLQGKDFCEVKKNLRTYRGWGCQFAHAFVQSALAYVFVAEWKCWWLPIVVFGSHLLLDVGKALVGRDNMLSFVADQVLHIAVLAAVYSLLTGCEWSLMGVNWPKVWVVALAYFIVLIPASVFIEIFNRRFGETQDGKSLTAGGKYIGFLERALIVSFILCGWIEGIGYLLAAKSVFRFGDLKNNKELKHTEYVLVGTFLSFTVAVIAGLLAQMLLGCI